MATDLIRIEALTRILSRTIQVFQICRSAFLLKTQKALNCGKGSLGWAHELARCDFVCALLRHKNRSTEGETGLKLSAQA